MAKGNDGNLLQHWVEAALAARLCAVSEDWPLHVTLTHGMEPFERFDPRTTGVGGFRRLDAWLAAAHAVPLPNGAPAVASAYRECGASADHYPNSAEILAAVVGRARLRGVVTECDGDKFKVLAAAWPDGLVHVVHGSWRQSLSQHSCPANLGGPWLFSMDPMTFVRDPDRAPAPDDANLRPSDLAMVAPVLSSYLASRRPGAASIFCFSLRKKPGFNSYDFFKTEIKSLAGRLKCHYDFCEVPLANPHVGAILSMDDGLIAEVLTEWNAKYDTRSGGS